MVVCKVRTTVQESIKGTEMELPGIKVVCLCCEGSGRIGNPSIYEHTYTSREFLEEFDDEESREDYFAGAKGIYGIKCPDCDGERIISVVDEEELEGDTLMEWREECEERERSARERASERRMGC